MTVSPVILAKSYLETIEHYNWLKSNVQRTIKKSDAVLSELAGSISNDPLYLSGLAIDWRSRNIEHAHWVRRLESQQARFDDIKRLASAFNQEELDRFWACCDETIPHCPTFYINVGRTVVNFESRFNS